MSADHNTRKTLLVSGVAEVRSNDRAEIELTRRLVGRVRDVAGESWNVVLSWAETDGVEGTLTQLRQADAVVIMGGPDVSPEHYGGATNYIGAGPRFPVSDASQMALVHAAVDGNVPILGICRGLQIMNVALGGTLIQHLDGATHSNPQMMENFVFARHTVTVDESTSLGAALRDSVGSTPEVHSAHHQAIEKMAGSLVAAAYSGDGIIEAVQHVSAPAIAVQWHPEDPDADDAILRTLFSYLDGCCRMHMRGSRMPAVA